MSIGRQLLPLNILQSSILTASELDLLAGLPALPVIDPAFYDERLKNIFQYYSINPEEMELELHVYAKELLNSGQVDAAWQVLLTIS